MLYNTVCSFPSMSLCHFQLLFFSLLLWNTTYWFTYPWSVYCSLCTSVHVSMLPIVYEYIPAVKCQTNVAASLHAYRLIPTWHTVNQNASALMSPWGVDATRMPAKHTGTGKWHEDWSKNKKNKTYICIHYTYMINRLITLRLLLTCTDECGGSCSLIPGEMLGSLPLNCQLVPLV